MELVEGSNLQEVIDRRGRIPPSEALAMESNRRATENPRNNTMNPGCR